MSRKRFAGAAGASQGEVHFDDGVEGNNWHEDGESALIETLRWSDDDEDVEPLEYGSLEESAAALMDRGLLGGENA